MIAGLIFFGMIAGVMAGLIGLMTGAPVWVALLLYGGFGALFLLVGAMAQMLRANLRANPKTSLPMAQPDR